MTKTAVVNASPLIFLDRAGHLALLHTFYDRVLVPEAVCAEIVVRDERTTGVDLTAHAWIERITTPAPPNSVTAWSLGPGESAVIALALTLPESEAVIDDLLGRRCAQAHGLALRGTLEQIKLICSHVRGGLLHCGHGHFVNRPTRTDFGGV